MQNGQDAQKRALRAEFRERRLNLTTLERDRSRAGLTQQLIALAEHMGARSCSAYLPTADEPDITGFLEWAQEQRIRVLLPRSRDDGLLDWGELTAAALEPGKYGILEPAGTRLNPGAVADVDLMIIPASSVDQSGMRLGWGRGYFDRTLGALVKRPPAYAVIYDHEFVDQVPQDSHDHAVDGVVTPTRFVSFSESAAR